MRYSQDASLDMCYWVVLKVRGWSDNDVLVIREEFTGLNKCLLFSPGICQHCYVLLLLFFILLE